MKKVVLNTILFLFVFSFLASNNVSAFGFKKLLGGDKASETEQKKTGQQAQQFDTKAFVENLLQDLLKSKAVELRGRLMMAKIENAKLVAIKVLSDSQVSLNSINKVNAGLAQGEADLSGSLSELTTNLVLVNVQLQTLKNSVEKAIKKSEKELAKTETDIGDEKKIATDEMSKTMEQAKEDSEKQEKSLEASNTINSDEIVANLRQHSEATQETSKQAKKNITGRVEKFKREINEIHNEVKATGKKTGEAINEKLGTEFYDDIINFTGKTLIPASYTMSYALGILKAQQKNIPIVDKYITKAVDASNEDRKDVIKDAAKLVLVLTLHKDNIMKSIDALKKNPIKNMREIKELKKYADMIFYFVNTLNSFNKKMKEANQRIGIVARALRNSETILNQTTQTAAATVTYLNDSKKLLAQAISALKK